MKCSINEEGVIKSEIFARDGVRTILYFPLPPEPFGDKKHIQIKKEILFDDVPLRGTFDYVKQKEDAGLLYYQVYFSLYNSQDRLKANISGKEECVFSPTKGYFILCNGSFDFSSEITPPDQAKQVRLLSKSSFSAKIKE